MTALRDPWMSVEEYLAGELVSEVRHEYLGGCVYAMAGASDEHNVIAGNIFAALRTHLRGHRCRAYINDMKVLPRPLQRDTFYYPDVLVACHPGEPSRFFKEHPSLIVEVLSPETARVDRTEKFDAYTAIPSLETYVLVEQSRLEVTVFQRVEAVWKKTVLVERESLVRFPVIAFEMTLTSIYEDVAI